MDNSLPPNMYFKLVQKQWRFSGQLLVVAWVESSLVQQEQAFKQSTVVLLPVRLRLQGNSVRSRPSSRFSSGQRLCTAGGGGRTTCNSISSMKTSASGTILPVSCCRRAILAGCGRDRLSQPCAHAGGTACLEGQLVPLRTESILRCALVLQRVCDCEMFSPADCVLRFVDMKVHMSLSSF